MQFIIDRICWSGEEGRIENGERTFFVVDEVEVAA